MSALLSSEKKPHVQVINAEGRKNRMKGILTSLLNPPTQGPASTLLLRLMAGGVFLWEGILKFAYANQGVGRFTKLGMPFPHMTAHFVAGLEIAGDYFCSPAS
jgi:hypothetical protein